MNIAILNYCGLVGKTTLAANLFVPRMPGAKFIAIETINETAADLGLEIEMIKGGNFISLYKKLGQLSNIIVDVGSSNVESFLAGLMRFEDAHEDVDYFVVPTLSGSREQKETIKTIKLLAGLGVPAKKIRILFNVVEEDVKEEFRHVLDHVKTTKSAIANENCGIYRSEVYDLLNAQEITLPVALADTKDYKAMVRNETLDEATFDYYSNMRAIKSLSPQANENLDNVFKNLFKG